VEPASPQSFTATAVGKDKINLSWQNGDPGICTLTYKIDAYQLKTGDRVIGTETGAYGLSSSCSSSSSCQRYCLGLIFVHLCCALLEGPLRECTAGWSKSWQL
jgi:hypothetical protein